MSDAWELLNSKVSVPSEMRTAEWSAVPQWLRERQFYSAGVARADILEVFRNEVAANVSGQSSIGQSRKNIEQFLDRIGYQPERGQAGTIKDLRSVRRIEVMLATNVRLLQGWAQKERGLKAIRAYPAWEFIRFEGRKKKRVWITRWLAAGGKLYAGRMIALKDSPVWLELGNGDLDSLGVDYPPFAWGSGMGWRAVPFSKCKALGVLNGWKPPLPKPPKLAQPDPPAGGDDDLATISVGEPPLPGEKIPGRAVSGDPAGWDGATLNLGEPQRPGEAIPRRPLSSPNESLQTRPQITDGMMRKALADRMQGLAEWQGDTFVFTDPNGTRNMSADMLDAVWRRGMPERFHRETAHGNDEGLFQRQALKRWVEHPEVFETSGNPNLSAGRLDAYDDLVRLFNRIEAMPGKVQLFRPLAFESQAKLDEFLAALKKSGIYQAPPTVPGEAWSVSVPGLPSEHQITLVCENSMSAKNLTPLTDVTGGLVIFTQGVRFRVVSIDGSIIHLEELP